MLTPDKRAVLENAADLLEELGHAGAQPLRELIRDTRLETLVTFVLYGGFVSVSRTGAGDVRLQSKLADSTTQTDVVVEKIRVRGVEVILSEIDRDISVLEKHIDHPICERGENPLADCLAVVLDTTIRRVCPNCGSTIWPTSDPVSLTMTCNACGFQMRTLQAEE